MSGSQCVTVVKLPGNREGGSSPAQMGVMVHACIPMKQKCRSEAVVGYNRRLAESGRRSECRYIEGNPCEDREKLQAKERNLKDTTDTLTCSVISWEAMVLVTAVLTAAEERPSGTSTLKCTSYLCNLCSVWTDLFRALASANLTGALVENHYRTVRLRKSPERAHLRGLGRWLSRYGYLLCNSEGLIQVQTPRKSRDGFGEHTSSFLL